MFAYSQWLPRSLCCFSIHFKLGINWREQLEVNKGEGLGANKREGLGANQDEWLELFILQMGSDVMHRGSSMS